MRATLATLNAQVALGSRTARAKCDVGRTQPSHAGVVEAIRPVAFAIHFDSPAPGDGCGHFPNRYETGICKRLNWIRQRQLPELVRAEAGLSSAGHQAPQFGDSAPPSSWPNAPEGEVAAQRKSSPKCQLPQRRRHQPTTSCWQPVVAWIFKRRNQAAADW